MSNLDNVFQNCPALMSDGRTSVVTDYKSKNETLKDMIGDSTNSYQFRDKLQASGFSSMNNVYKYNTCSTVPLGDIKLDKNINMDYTTGDFRDAFKPLIGSVKTVSTTTARR